MEGEFGGPEARGAGGDRTWGRGAGMVRGSQAEREAGDKGPAGGLEQE